MDRSRRAFLKTTAIAGSGLLLPYSNILAQAGDATLFSPYAGNVLLAESYELLKRWGTGLLATQINQPGDTARHGALLCPACNAIHGRCADAAFPLLLLADKTHDHRYSAAALKLYNWMELNTSQPDGSWINEASVSNWKGITVFTSIALAESLIHFGHLLDASTKQRWTDRLAKASEYLYREFTIKTGNINYPVTCSYALSLAGGYLGEKRFSDKGKALAHEALAWFTPNDKLLYGEGHPVPGRKGYSVDLGYNVEESLPSLVLYGKLTGDKEVLDVVAESLKAHLAFMLPDGSWDNSWGTRNYKWTWWGSRTSDGCQPAYALMADYDPVFYKAALLNTRLLNECTHKNLLYGGPHYVKHGILPCVHHTFSHSKALATILVKKAPAPTEPLSSLLVPRQHAQGIKMLADINTCLMARDNWLATVTGYDQEYTMKSGHASGGALSLLWHLDTGPLVVAGMNKYQVLEGLNMQPDTDPRSMCLTPRFEWTGADGVYMNINDLNATVEDHHADEMLTVVTKSKLVNENQVPARVASPECDISYTMGDFTAGNGFTIRARCGAASAGKLTYILPLVTTRDEKITIVSPTELLIHKPVISVKVKTNTPMHLPLGVQERIFNFVPGMEAFPIELAAADIEIRLSLLLVNT